MRDYGRKQEERPRTRLERGADGRLRSVDSYNGSDINDIWAEQKRIRLAEAIQQDQEKADRLGKPSWWRRFGRKGVKKAAVAKLKPTPKPTREIILTLGLPRLRLPKWVIVSLKKVSKRQAFLGGGIGLGLIVLTVGGYLLLPGTASTPRQGAGVTSEVLDTAAERPDFQTILPGGKSINDLGGWRRVSPPDKEPVFAYTDNINDVHINVSQQQLPENFVADTPGNIAKLAEQFTAKEKITAGGEVAYIGTSAKGPQSVILAKNGLLILIKSSQQIPNELWGVYISSLR